MRIKEYGLFVVVILYFCFLLFLQKPKGKEPIGRKVLAIREERTAVGAGVG